MRKFKWTTLAALTTGIMLLIGPCGWVGMLGVTAWLLESAGMGFLLAN